MNERVGEIAYFLPKKYKRLYFFSSSFCRLFISYEVDFCLNLLVLRKFPLKNSDKMFDAQFLEHFGGIFRFLFVNFSNSFGFCVLKKVPGTDKDIEVINSGV